MNDNLTLPSFLDDPAIIAADDKAVQDFLDAGIPVALEVRDRIRARSDRAREENFLRRGYVNIDDYRRPSSTDEE